MVSVLSSCEHVGVEPMILWKPFLVALFCVDLYMHGKWQMLWSNKDLDWLVNNLFLSLQKL